LFQDMVTIKNITNQKNKIYNIVRIKWELYYNIYMEGQHEIQTL